MPSKRTPADPPSPKPKPKPKPKGRAAASAEAPKPTARAKTAKTATKARPKATPRGATTRRSTRRRAGTGGSWFSVPTGGWRRWLLVEVVTVLAGILVGLAIAGGTLWSRARGDVAAYLADPPRPIPSVVWSAPIRVAVGMRASVPALAGDLLAAGYERVDRVAQPEDPRTVGVFAVTADGIELWSAPWSGPTGEVAGGAASIAIRDGVVRSTSAGRELVVRPTVLGTLGDQEAERSPVRLADLSEWVEPALLAMEDTRFRQHYGVDPVGVLRALFSNATGTDVQGGSTLTQQLAKNLFLTRERTLRRKVREAFFAMALEQQLGKDALLELYLTEVYLGQMGGLPLYGVDAAARAWFGISAKNLNLAQAAVIVGAIPAPNAWSPVRNPNAAVERRRVVLDRMKALGRIDDARYAIAVSAPLDLKGLEPSRIRRAPYAVDAAVDRAEESLGFGALASGGYQVYTAIQPLLQRAAEEAVAQGMADLDADYPKAAGAQVALVAVRIDDGAVVAMVGGRSYAASAFNRARDAQRLAGSTIKPLTMAKAIDDGSVTASTLLEDQPLSRTVGGVTWAPQNYDKTWLGEVTLRQAIESSRNIPAIHVAEKVGPGRLQRFLRDVGLSHATNLPSAALGGFTASPLEMAGAYTVFGRGVAYRPRVLLHVDDARGERVLDLQPEGSPSVSEQAAAVAVHLLQGVIQNGTGAGAGRFGVGPPAAGKTGTTDEYRDAWFVGLTPELAVAVWVGRDEGTLGLSGSRGALPTWARFVAASGSNRGAMPRPGGVAIEEVCAESGMLARDACESTYDEWFVAGHVPTDKCEEHGGIIRPGRLFGRLFGRKRGADDQEGEGDAEGAEESDAGSQRKRRRDR
jgi:penicillin-binding protein 1B